MSLLVKGMEMPDKCGSCPCFHAEHPIHCQAVKADKAKRIAAPYGLPRPDWCPLVERPDEEDEMIVIPEDEFKTYSRALLVALALRDLLHELCDLDKEL